jgi:hypothetical protein
MTATQAMIAERIPFILSVIFLVGGLVFVVYASLRNLE